jgi:hypothetical protein
LLSGFSAKKIEIERVHGGGNIHTMIERLEPPQIGEYVLWQFRFSKEHVAHLDPIRKHSVFERKDPLLLRR